MNKIDLSVEKLKSHRVIKNAPIQEIIHQLNEREQCINNFFELFDALHNHLNGFVNRDEIMIVANGLITSGIIGTMINLLTTLDLNQEKKAMKKAIMPVPPDVGATYMKLFINFYEKLSCTIYICSQSVNFPAPNISKLNAYFSENAHLTRLDNVYIPILFTLLKTGARSLNKHPNLSKNLEQIVTVIDTVKNCGSACRHMFFAALSAIIFEIITSVGGKLTEISDSDFIELISIMKNLYSSSTDQASSIQYWLHKNVIKNMLDRITTSTYASIFEILAVLCSHRRCAEIAYAFGISEDNILSWDKLFSFIKECYR